MGEGVASDTLTVPVRTEPEEHSGAPPARAAADAPAVAEGGQGAPPPSTAVAAVQPDPPGAAPRARRRGRGTLLPDDWRPGPAEFDHARRRGFSDPEIRDIADGFATYWTAGNGRNTTHLDWPAAWRSWCAKERPRGVARAGPGRDPMAGCDEIDRILFHDRDRTDSA